MNFVLLMIFSIGALGDLPYSRVPESLPFYDIVDGNLADENALIAASTIECRHKDHPTEPPAQIRLENGQVVMHVPRGSHFARQGDYVCESDSGTTAQRLPTNIFCGYKKNIPRDTQRVLSIVGPWTRVRELEMSDEQRWWPFLKIPAYLDRSRRPRNYANAGPRAHQVQCQLRVPEAFTQLGEGSPEKGTQQGTSAQNKPAKKDSRAPTSVQKYK